MYRLYDSFNQVTISRHKTLEAMVKADQKYSRMIRRSNGPSSYIPMKYLNDDYTPISDSDMNSCCRYSINR